MFLSSFVSSESGAVTVDWVVMSAALVGLGLATTAVVSGGIEDLSGDIRASLVSMEVGQTFGAIAAVTADMVQTALWDSPGQTSTEFANVDQLSFMSEVTFSTGDEGIIFETGGTGRGIILYQHDGMLYLQAGAGNTYGESATRGEAMWEVADGTFTIEGSMNADGGLALYVDGDLVDQSSFQAPNLAGGNSGTIAGGTNSVARNRGGFTQNTGGHPGVTEVAFFEGQTTGDELVPMN